jgi:hypothetical protein
MASGDVQIALAGSSPIAAGASQGVDLELAWIVEDIASAEALVARNGSGIAKIEDLKGKKVAVPFVSTTHFHLLFALEHFGVDPKDVEILNLQPPQIAAAWERGDIDAAFVWDPALGQIKKSGEVVITSGELSALGKPTFDGLIVGDPGLAGDIGEPTGEIRDYRRNLERRTGEVRRHHLAQRVELGPGPLGIAHQVLVQDDAEITRPLPHLFKRAKREARAPALSMRFRVCSPLWPTDTSSALTWPPPSTARRICVRRAIVQSLPMPIAGRSPVAPGAAQQKTACREGVRLSYAS